MSLGTFQIALTADQFKAVAAEVAAMGLNLGASTGTLPETSGVVLSYTVTPGELSTVITFTVQEKPFFASVGMIESKVRQEMGVAA
jgi:hypothetical protein